MMSFFMAIMACIAFGFLDEVEGAGEDDLPVEAELVLEPAAGDFAAAVGDERPVVVDFFLRIAVDDKGDGLGELKRLPGHR